MQNENFIVIQGWMRKELNLKGNELLIYSLIYGFSQDNESEFGGTLNYIVDWVGISKSNVFANLKKLISKGLIEKREIPIANNLHMVRYKAVVPEFYNKYGINEKVTSYLKQERGVPETGTGRTQNRNGAYLKQERGVPEIEPNNINNNIVKNINNNIRRFTPPTLEEVEQYCIERGNDIDPEQFIDHYEARGWELTKGRKMKDWKACVRTWERNGYSKPKKNLSPYGNTERYEMVDRWEL